jgi:hypothetical protein
MNYIYIFHIYILIIHYIMQLYNIRVWLASRAEPSSARLVSSPNRASRALALPLLFVQTFEHLPLSMAIGSRSDHQNLGGAMAHLAHGVDPPLYI